MFGEEAVEIKRMASKQRDIAKIISQIKNQVEEAINKNGSTRKEVEQQVTDLQRQVSEFQNSANKVLDENMVMLQSLDEQLARCSKLLENPAKNAEGEAGGTTTDAEKCTSGDTKESGTDSNANNSDHNLNNHSNSDNIPGSRNEKLLLGEHNASPGHSSDPDVVPQQNTSRVQKKYPVLQQKRHELTWNRVKLAQRLTHEEDDGTSVAKDVEVTAIDGYGKENEQFKYPYHLVNGPNNELIVSDRDSHQLIVFNYNLQFLYAFGGRGKEVVGNGTFYNPTGLAVDKIGNFLYVADQNNLIQRFQINEDSRCQFISQFGKKGRGKGQFNCPCGLLFTQSNQLFACDYRNHRVQVFEKGGKFLHAFGRHGTKPGEFKEPHSIAINNSENKIFITDHSNNRIQIFNPHGKFLAVFENGPSLNQQLQFPRGIFCTADGHLLVSCTYTHCILELKEDGSYVSTIEEIIQPCGVVLRDNGDVVVTSNVNQSLMLIRGCNIES